MPAAINKSSFTPNLSPTEVRDLDREKCYNTNSVSNAATPWQVKSKATMVKNCSVHKTNECPKEGDADALMKDVCKGLRTAADKLRKSKGDVEEAKRDIAGALHELEEMEGTEKALNSRSFHIPRPMLEDSHRASSTATTRNFSKLVPPGVDAEVPTDPAAEAQRTREEASRKHVEGVRKAMKRADETHRVINPYAKTR